jgi:hypothetical protein
MDRSVLRLIHHVLRWILSVSGNLGFTKNAIMRSQTLSTDWRAFSPKWVFGNEMVTPTPYFRQKLFCGQNKTPTCIRR